MTVSIYQGTTSPDLTASLAEVQSYPPESSQTGVGLFNDIIQASAKMATTAASVASDFASGGSTAVAADFSSLIQQQIEIQKEMQITSMISNNEKSKHETAMSVIRNMRVA